MSSNASIGGDDPNNAAQSGIDDEAVERRKREEEGEHAARDITREDIEAGNDRNVSADDGGRSGRTSKGSDDDAIELGK